MLIQLQHLVGTQAKPGAPGALDPQRIHQYLFVSILQFPGSGDLLTVDKPGAVTLHIGLDLVLTRII